MAYVLSERSCRHIDMSTSKITNRIHFLLIKQAPVYSFLSLKKYAFELMLSEKIQNENCCRYGKLIAFSIGLWY
ncbi:MAG: hypothetical protein QG657_2524 [Acidobacteriota bacterium]|nr:hypothetical protein [Acidobacteriota bacterium]